MKKVTITCAHCGGMFEIKIPTSGCSGRAHQHSYGCNKRPGGKTDVSVNNGNITKTKKV